MNTAECIIKFIYLFPLENHSFNSNLPTIADNQFLLILKSEEAFKSERSK